MPIAEAPESLKGVKVLLVEDSEDNQEIFTFFLKSRGAEVTLVDNGLKAIEVAGANAFDIILMDIQLPGIDGKQATSRLRDLGVSIPIVALTAHAMNEEVEGCLKAGGNGHIAKPVSGEVLIAKIRKFIDMDRTDKSEFPFPASETRQEDTQVVT